MKAHDDCLVVLAPKALALLTVLVVAGGGLETKNGRRIANRATAAVVKRWDRVTDGCRVRSAAVAVDVASER